MADELSGRHHAQPVAHREQRWRRLRRREPTTPVGTRRTARADDRGREQSSVASVRRPDRAGRAGSRSSRPRLQRYPTAPVFRRLATDDGSADPARRRRCRCRPLPARGSRPGRRKARGRRARAGGSIAAVTSRSSGWPVIASAISPSTGSSCSSTPTTAPGANAGGCPAIRPTRSVVAVTYDLLRMRRDSIVDVRCSGQSRAGRSCAGAARAR